MFDNICKFLAETFPTDFAIWLLGEPIVLTELSPSELSLEPIRSDALILLQSEEVVLHLEFQTQPNRDIPFRMIDYRLRVHRRFPHKQMRQVVVYLQPTTSELVQQTTFTLENTCHNFEVIRLWEQPTPDFLQTPGLLPFAVLSKTDDRVEILQQVAQAISQITDRRTQSNVAASTFILAGLRLEAEVIQQILRRDVMQESVTYQVIKAEGSQEALRQVALNLLREGMEIAVVARVTGLAIAQVQLLAQAAG
ncbi:MAG: Rpn family recombination-promoting nuclease/putative transposase [Leptolyngbyaceae cyanobacterium CAN_BIN12]|nr:Rpn family recombination-promoting nuclease/putative transposase [Leptolyngbyaceae cyanobacterium CAN_BIN12]